MIYFIVNPGSHSSENGKIWSLAADALKKERLDYKVFATRYPGHGKKIARAISTRDPYATIASIGGDGSIHDILCGLTNLETITFGVIPCGSGNDFARGMHISRDPKQAMKAILTPKRYVSMDVGVEKSLYADDNGTAQKKDVKNSGYEQLQRFGVSCGIGFDAAICNEALSSPIKDFLNKVNLGNLTYAAICLEQIASYKKCGLTVEADGGDPLYFPDAYFAAVMNQKYEGGGVRMTPDAAPDDGLLDVIVVGDIPRAKICTVMPLAFIGKHTHLGGLHFMKCSEVKITADRACAVHYDGESGGMSECLHVGLKRERLRVITG